MDIKLKQTALRNLARTAGDIAESAIKKEFIKINDAFKTETNYNQISDQLDFLNTIAYRVPEDSVSGIKDLLKRLKSLELTYDDHLGYSEERLREYQNNFTLMVKALDVLEHIRYHQLSEILDIFFEFSCSKQKDIAAKANHGIEKLAGYDLEIFYGDGKEWHGLGYDPQEKILDKIDSFDGEQKKTFFPGIIVACEQILSPVISGTSSNYKSVTWRTGAVPAIDGVKEVRHRALNVLQDIFSVAENISQKKAVINTMETATRLPHMGEYGEEVMGMINENTRLVLEFLKIVADSGEMQLMQKIEHDAYWMLQHKGGADEAIRDKALAIRDSLYTNDEFQVYRILIGFESIFRDWESKGRDSEDYEKERNYRESEAIKYAESIDESSFVEWKERIIRYASIESKDLATFPYFGKFLEHFGKSSPSLALKFLLEDPEKIERFLVAILCGIAETDLKKEVYDLIDRWCDEGKYLFSLARFFEFTSEVNETLLGKILNRAQDINDLDALNQIISSVAAKYSESNRGLAGKYLMPALKYLSNQKNTGWILGFWFRKNRADILLHMSDKDYKEILANLIWLNSIDYHAEEILYVIAKKSPVLVVQYLCDRLSVEAETEDLRKYDAIPYSFYKLNEPLSKIPEQSVELLLRNYEGNYGMFIYRGARLLRNIFPNFEDEFQESLLNVFSRTGEKNQEFVLAILRNYDGNPVIYNFCRELIKILPEQSRFENEIMIILQSTGVVSGEYGFANAYKQKIEDIQTWLEDENTSVKGFASRYIESLEKQIEYEIKRADEDIALRKYQYGADED